MEYIAYLHKDRKSDFGVSFPDFPGCVTAGKTLDEARRMAAEALALHIEGMAEDGEPIPEPSTIDDVAEDPAMRGAVAFLVSVGLDKTVRLNITAREGQVASIDQKADEAGMTRSAYMVRAALAHGTKAARPKATAAQKQLGLSAQVARSKRKTGERYPVGHGKPKRSPERGRHDNRKAQPPSAPNRA
jgi:predicted RNase H-like HicB family nuclease